MSFIRAKEIPPGSGNWYDYEVETIHEGGKVIQKHIRYVGKHGTGDRRLLGGDAKPNTQPVATPSTSTPLADTTRIPKMKTSAKHIASAMGMYYSGMSLDAIQQLFRQDHSLDMSESNFWNWIARFTREAVKQANTFKPEVGDYWVADETYMKLSEKTVYFWDIIDEKTRYLLASHVSFRRSAVEAKKLMELARDRAGKTPKVVITDKLKSYLVAVEDAYGADSKHVPGGPFGYAIDNESTGRIERFHKTLEQRTRVFHEYKDINGIRLLTDGWLINYNFMKQNEGCGNVPPAQAMSKIVPFKDWNDIVRDKNLPDIDYKVSLHRRPSVKKGYPVYDATLKPFEVKKESA